MKPRSRLETELAAELATAREQGLERRLEPLDDALVDLCSNDYLGLARHPAVLAAARAALEQEGLGGRASRALGGGGSTVGAFEARAAQFFGAEAALFLPSGYHANLALVTTLAGRGDLLVCDELNHASLVDAARLSAARIIKVPHGDLEAVRIALGQKARRRIVLWESVFSMDGDLAPLEALARVCAEHEASLVLDEAHALGLLGPEGSGAWNGLRLGPELRACLAARVFPCGKALGGAGALVAGRQVLVQRLINGARSFLYSTAAPPALVAGLACALELMRRAQQERVAVLHMARVLAQELGAAEPAAAIVPYLIGEPAAALAAAQTLRARGFEVRAVRPPSVPRGTARLRLVCHSTNEVAELRQFAQLLRGMPQPTAKRATSTRRARVFFVVGTDTDVGKTVASALLVAAARQRGRVCYWKPVQTGPDSDTAEVVRLARSTRHEWVEPCLHFSRPAAPDQAAAAEGRRIDEAMLDARLAELSSSADLEFLIVELAGGLLVPLRPGFTNLDWLMRTRPELVLVARSGLGTLNHTLLTLEALAARGLEPRAVLLMGDPHPDNEASLRAQNVKLPLLRVPRFETLSPKALETFLSSEPFAELLR